jgi:hypothetical protein
VTRHMGRDVLLGVAVGVALGLVLALSLAVSRPAVASSPLVLDSHTPMVVRTEDTSGAAVLPPRRVEIQKYIDTGDAATRAELTDLEFALEADIHAHDPKFTRTHDLIDGK